MARPRSNSPQRKGKGTSFGKKSDAEKTFRKRKSSSRSGRSDSSVPSKPWTSSREDRGTGNSFRSKPGQGEETRFRKGEGSSFRPRTEGPAKFSRPYQSDGDREKKPFRKSDGASFRPKSDQGEEKNFRKSESSSFRPRSEGSGKFSRPSGGDNKKPFRKSDGASFRARPDNDGEKSFRKSGGSSFRPRPEGPAKFSKPYQSGSGGEKKTFRKSDGASFRARPEKDEERSFRKDADSSSGSRSEHSEFSKPNRKGNGFTKSPSFEKRDDAPREEGERKSFQKPERKSFVQSRVVTSADFTKPGKKTVAAEPKEATLTRLNKYVANAGVGSRREADELIKMGLISVNGTTVTVLGTKVKAGDEVRYEDRVLKAEKLVYILLNKPKGFITTTEDPQERSTVMGLVASACKERIYPVGRLDRNTTGLLLLTNDGDLADKLTHPSYKAKKVYKAELDKPLTKNDFKKILEGVHLEEGRAMVDDLAIISEDDKTVGLEIHIGWNRVVRRIFETLGYDVLRLDRSVFAGLDKKDLSRGQWRFLKPEEIVRLKHFK